MAYLVIGRPVLLIDVLFYELVEFLLHRVEVLYVRVQRLALFGQIPHDSSQPLLANLGVRGRTVNRDEYLLGGPRASNDCVQVARYLELQLCFADRLFHDCRSQQDLVDQTVKVYVQIVDAAAQGSARRGADRSREAFHHPSG